MKQHSRKKRVQWSMKDKLLSGFMLVLGLFMLVAVSIMLTQFYKRLNAIDNAQQDHSVLNKK